MFTGKTAVSLVARGGTTDCAVSPVHNVFDARPPHALLPGNLVSSGVMSCRRVQVGNALEGPQWSGSTQRLLRLSDEHVVSE